MNGPIARLRRLARLSHRKVRYKLLALALVPVLLVMPVAVALIVLWGQDFSYTQLFRKVSTDLRVARHAFQNMQEEYLDELGRLAQSYRFRRGFEQENHAGLERMLMDWQGRNGLAFLHLTDTEGRWLVRAPRGGHSRTRPTRLRARVANVGEPASGIEVFSNAELRHENPAVADKVILSLVDTPRAAPTERTRQQRAMVIRLLYPVEGATGRVTAILDGGLVLNQNFAFVDAIRDLVYGEGSLPEGSHGAVTVLLDDVRISTNVPIRAGERALGTRVSETVREQVLERGEHWVDRAFVVNDWYISAYDSINNVRGERVGMLYAGFLEAPFRESVLGALGVMLLLMTLVLLAAGIMAVRGARAIFQPVEAMAEVVRATMAGKERRIGALRSEDEIGELARQFDRMLELLQQRNHELERATERLEEKVAERTATLTRRNRELSETVETLHQTRRQLVMAEKLAAVGQLTAGIAHEINNPTAVILGHLDLLAAELDDDSGPVKQEIEVIIHQIDRIRNIIDNLLQYTRPRDSGVALAYVDVNEVVSDSLGLVRHELKGREIRVDTTLGATRPIKIKRQELQQVLVNLLMNAVQAVGEQGYVRIETGDWRTQGVVLAVTDNGGGIRADAIDRVFDPFFSTKRDGTGLGLSMSYGMVRGYGGDVTVMSEEGVGSTFRVWLLREPEVSEEPLLAVQNGLDRESTQQR